ncbi:ATP-binding protein [Streptomyces sp. NPDC102441]|uniref:ATP-binding protein n=1 Tax=Streptomyces sp. NPDC102441 TaxID=3366176 RepID=UPI003822F355
MVRLDELTGAAHAGRGGAFVLRGESGIGKSILLDHAERATAGYRTVRAYGASCEAELPFVGRHQLRLAMASPLDELSAPHCAVVRTAFSPAAEARALPSTGLAALEPLSCAARPRSLRCLFDNGQWLDETALKPLTFLARRVGCEPGAMVFGARPQQVAGKTGVLSNLSDQPGQFAGGPSESDAQALLAANSHVMSDDPVRRRLAAEARGNARALLGPPKPAGMPRRTHPPCQPGPSAITHPGCPGCPTQFTFPLPKCEVVENEIPRADNYRPSVGPADIDGGDGSGGGSPR